MTPSSQPHPRDEVQAVVDRYRELRRRIDEGLEANAFGALADFYTDDAVYVDAAWGRIEGKEEIAKWLEHSMVGLGDWKFPIEFTAIEGDDVIVKWTQIIPERGRTARPIHSRPTHACATPATASSPTRRTRTTWCTSWRTSARVDGPRPKP